MISFDQFIKIINKLYPLGKIELFAYKDENSHDCLTMYLTCSSIDNSFFNILIKLEPEYWNITTHKEKLQIYLSSIYVNRELSFINEYLKENLYLNIEFGKEKSEQI
ncbi:MAG: hypothetical protein ACR2NW_05760 [Thermodesulfobacteriota bacterium]